MVVKGFARLALRKSILLTSPINGVRVTLRCRVVGNINAVKTEHKGGALIQTVLSLLVGRPLLRDGRP